MTDYSQWWIAEMKNHNTTKGEKNSCNTTEPLSETQPTLWLAV